MSLPRAVPAAAAPVTAAGWAVPPRPIGPAIAAGFGIALASLALLGVLIYLVSALGAVSVVVAAIGALVPFAIVLLVVRWIDRWEPEPRSALVFAVLWGAGVATGAALLFDLGVDLLTATTGQKPDEVVQAIVQAPIVEETAKGVGVLLILWVGRRWFDGPVDGVVYAASVGAGFAFTENVLYFGRTVAESGVGGDLAVIFVARGLFSPFAHALFTSCTGYALGRAAERTHGVGVLGYFVLGLIPAAILHALWNGGLALAADPVRYYISIEVPIFVLALAALLALRARERRITRMRLSEYAEAGWFAHTEVDLLSSWSGRRQALAWADQQPDRVRKRAAMRRFLRDATRLGHASQRLSRERTGVGRTPDEQALLAALATDRALLAG